MEKQYTKMTDLEKYAAKHLASCTFRINSFDKRFAKDMKSRITDPEAKITDRQRYFLWYHINRYRRQIADQRLVGHAQRFLAEQLEPSAEYPEKKGRPHRIKLPNNLSIRQLSLF